ncbi:hypothetical protein, conserved [Babesia bigemina]|uniref:Uncharacterized protein n=1 Tax=Babesia bigemina TaxID=5866 RepID=A0A061DER3_BABBI|nr:hypothetical protein, conserved [Babesia bigemina]CDR97730.1 hypothetical protein, conserved [Babesia bigemina]|eukprot:XP_012769916.1 hypothetical protein, conserved [Babesia bigemina]
MTHGFQPLSSSGATLYIPGQLELIDTGVSSASDSDTCEQEAIAATPRASAVREQVDKSCRATPSTASRVRRTPKASPVRVALRRYAVTKSETLQHLYEHWTPLLTRAWPQDVQGAANVLAECNSLIGIQRRWLSNYECALLFRQLATDAYPDPERLRCVLGLLLRWWFCGKFAVHLAQFPHLGNEAVLVNAAYGILSSSWTQARLMLQLLECHDTLGELLYGVLIHPTEAQSGDHAIDAASCNSLLLKVLPIIKRGLLEPDPEPACSKATRFIEDMSTKALYLRFDRGFDNKRLHLRHECRTDDKLSLVEKLWGGVLRCNVANLQSGQPQRCDCHGRMAGILLNLISKTTSLGTHGSSSTLEGCRQLSTRRLIGYFAKWVAAKTPKANKNGAVVPPQESSEGQTEDKFVATGMAGNCARQKPGEASSSSCDNRATSNCCTLNRSAQLLLDTELAADSLQRVDECVGLCAGVVFSKPPLIKEEPGVDEARTTGAPIALNTSDTFIVMAFGNIWDNRNSSADPVHRACMTLLAGAILMIEDNHLMGDVILDEGYSRPLLASKLSQSDDGRVIVDKVLRHRQFYSWSSGVANGKYNGCSEPSAAATSRAERLKSPVDSAARVDYIMGEPSQHLGEVHRALCEAAGVCSNNASFVPALMIRDAWTSSTRHNVVFKMCRQAAYHVLDGLWQVLQQGETCSANISLEVGDGDCRRSATAYAMVALASLMGDTVVLQTADAHVGIVRIAVLLGRGKDFASPDYGSHITDDNLLNLLLKLLYTDIATDASMALECHSSQLAIYRTLLVHYLRKALLQPTKQAFDIGFAGKRVVDFDAIFRRILRLIFFRVHVALVDRPKFESFLRTRVEYAAQHDNTDNEGEFLEEINCGYIELSDDDTGRKTSSDGDVGVDGAIDHRIFGFLEYSPSHRVARKLWRRFVKSEHGGEQEEMPSHSGPLDRSMAREAGAANSEHPRFSKGMPDMDLLFFESVFELCGQLRFCVDEDQLFRHNKVDRLLYQLFLHICHVDKGANIQRNYETNVLCKINRVHETDEYGEVDTDRATLDSLGWKQGSVGMPSGGSTACEQPADEQKECGYVNLDVLFLSRQKFTKRSYYVLSRLAIESLVRWLSPESAACAVCRWASSVPIDTTSRVKAYKPATASAIVTMLSLSMLCHVALPSAEELPLQKVESLVSAANVCFVNLTVSFTAAATIPDAVEVIGSDEDEGSERGDSCAISRGGGAHVEPTGDHIKVKEEPNETCGAASTGSGVEPAARVKRERPSVSDDLCRHSVNQHSCDERHLIASTDEHYVAPELAEGAWQRGRSYVPGGLQMWKDHKIREHRARQLCLMRLRNHLRKRLIKEGVHLLQICVVFVHILGHVVLQTANCLLNPQNGYVTASHTAATLQECSSSEKQGCFGDSNNTDVSEAPPVGTTTAPVIKEGVTACPSDIPSSSLTSFTTAEDGWVTPPSGNRDSSATSPGNATSKSRSEAHNANGEGQQGNGGVRDGREAIEAPHRHELVSNADGEPVNAEGVTQPVIDAEGVRCVPGAYRDPARSGSCRMKDYAESDTTCHKHNSDASMAESKQTCGETRGEHSCQRNEDTNAVDYPNNLGTKDSHQMRLSADPKLASKFECAMQFLGLACNTLDSLLGACSTVSRCCVGDDLEVAIWDNDRMIKAAEEELELLLHEISFLRDQVEAHIAPLRALHSEAMLTADYPSTQDSGAGRHLKAEHKAAQSGDDESCVESGDSSSDGDCSGAEYDDDLGSFVDFETDSHLGMVTFRRPNKRANTASRLRDVVLRSEWNCLIKSYLS